MLSSYVLYQLGRLATGVLPRAGGLRLAEALGDAQFLRAAPERQAIQNNFRLITGQSVDEHSPVVRDVFRNFARYLFEFFHAHQYDLSDVAIEGASHLASASQGGRGLIIASAHLGNWELGAIALHRLGYPMTIVALPHTDPRVNALFDRQRRRCGVEVIAVGPQATKRALNMLRTGGALGILGDREFGTNGIPISAFGRTVILPKGPALLSLRTGAAMVPVFMIREAPWRFRLHVEPPIWPQDARLTDHAVTTLTQRYSDALTRAIAQHPTQWIMLQPLAQVRASSKKEASPALMRLDSSI